MATAVADACLRDGLTARWYALGTSVVVRVTATEALAGARRVVEGELRAIDVAASRFRADSELSRLNAAGGRPLLVSPLLIEALEAAVRAAELTDGAVDPTLGDALELAGYVKDWRDLEPPCDPASLDAGTASLDAGTASLDAGTASLDAGTPGEERTRPRRPLVLTVRRKRAWESIEVDSALPSARLAAGIRLDLGATAKALAADRAAQAAARETGAGVLVSLGGDIATAGPAPQPGWLVHVTDDHRSPPTAVGQTVAIATGGLATSSTTVRRWLHAGRTMHHILDPRSGRPVERTWRTVSVAAASCLDANIAATAAIVLGARASAWLSERGLPARLVGRDGRATTVGDWPDQPGDDSTGPAWAVTPEAPTRGVTAQARRGGP
jgi:thiamine biosynthesis lipoprotein